MPEHRLKATHPSRHAKLCPACPQHNLNRRKNAFDPVPSPSTNGLAIPDLTQRDPVYPANMP